MADEVKTRRYDASRRRERALGTRAAILSAARTLFVRDGYAATSVAAIAREAGVAADTVYAAVGPKPALMTLLIETALSGTDEVVAGEERDYAVAMRAEPTLRGKLAIYAAAITAIMTRLSPILDALRTAAPTSPELASLWETISERRARNMRMLAADLASSGELRPDLSVDRVADIIWSMNGPEHYTMLVRQRSWTTDEFREWLLDAWTRLLSQDGQSAGAGRS
jgi:AcrR family transcriptional regulator